MHTFWDLFKESIIVQGVITLMVVATDCYLLAQGSIVPDFLQSATWVILGFWFGSKVVKQSQGGK